MNNFQTDTDLGGSWDRAPDERRKPQCLGRSQGRHGDGRATTTYSTAIIHPGIALQRYDTVDEIHAIDPATAVKTRVMLVPDRGGKDTLGRRRYWWYRKMFHH